MRIAFFGLPLAAYLLHRDGHDVVLAALSRKDAVGARRLRASIGPARVVMKPKLDGAFCERVKKAAPDLVVSWFWTTLIPPSIVELARLGGGGVHPSLLPRHRGPDPTSWAILSGDAVTGVTAHRIAPDYDTGAILGQRTLAIDERWDSFTLAKALDRPSLALLRELCRRFSRGEPVPETPQDERLATDAPMLEGDETILRWDEPTAAVLRRIRALAPSPGAATTIGDRDVVVLAARAAPAPAVLEAPGEAAFVGGRALVKTRDGALELLAVEADGSVLKGSDLRALLT